MHMILNRAAISVVLCFCFLLSSASAQTTPVEWRYSARPGDNLTDISLKFLSKKYDWKDIAKYNGITNDDLIMVGQELLIPVAWLLAKPAPAKIIQLAGLVEIHTGSKVKKAEANNLVYSGEMVYVGPNSSAKMVFANKSEMIIQPNTRVLMDELSVYGLGFMADTKIRMPQGRVEINVPSKGYGLQKFQATTPSAVASVRGTRFLLEADDTKTIQQTKQGLVSVMGFENEVLVETGFSSLIRNGQAPLDPTQILPGPVLTEIDPKFKDFPIRIEWPKINGFDEWVLQVGSDSEMSQLRLSKKSENSIFDLGAIPNGSYYMRAWGVGSDGVPGEISLHQFEVDIPRTELGRVVELDLCNFESGILEIELDELKDGKRYLIEIAEDKEGRNPIWYAYNIERKIKLNWPSDVVAQVYLRAWVY